ncbi:hypothetical protein BMF94_1730 [Rhodotorula taiwanensis]|uniref:RRM domain-containing protein n=1 Tax=Rhodotorula taiwanensis TaxID=741276 RepID=A0A2S5BEA9_9BASI|nr:hypothetical protein BMF94_1730 [Rhodotorula taiwanensis]
MNTLTRAATATTVMTRGVALNAITTSHTGEMDRAIGDEEEEDETAATDGGIRNGGTTTAAATTSEAATRTRYTKLAPPRYDRDHGSHGRLHDPYHQPYEPHPGHQYTPQMHDPAYVNAVPYGSDPNEGRHSRGNSAGPTPRSKAPELEPPSASVILLGLPAHVTDVLLRNFLEDMGASIDSTTVIMDRQTGLSKRFGFAKFSSVEHARSFIEPNFPSIPWRERNGPGPDDGMRIKVNYSQKTGGWRDDQGASARLSEDQRATAGAATQGFYINDGTRDIGTTPSQMLLLRGIDPLTSEDEIASALTRVGGRAGQEVARGGLKRVLLVKDRASRSSWGFAFVQLADVRLATEVLSAAFNPQFHPTGFRIRNSIVAASFSHENSFVPLYSPSPWSFKGDGGAQLAYWDDKGFAQPWTPPAMPDPAAALRGVPKAPRAQEEAKAEADLAAFFDSIEEEMPAIADAEAPQSALTAQAISSEMAQSAPATVQAAATSALPSNKAAPAPISIKPITALPASIASSAASGSSTPHAESSGSSAKASAHTSTTVKGVSTPAPAPPVAAIPLEAKEKKGNLIVSRKAAPNLAKWNKKAKELRSAKPAPAAPAAAAATAEPVKATPKPQQQSTTSAAQATAVPTSSVSVAAFDDPEFVHGDPISFQCLLCQRQFKATNADNTEALAACATRKAAAAKKYAAAALADASSSKPKYIDRAAARRVALGRSDEPQPGQNNKKRKLEGPEPPKPTPAAPNKDGLEESNAGRKMLEKMVGHGLLFPRPPTHSKSTQGWSAGGGLGAEGAGRIDPVQAAQFAQGAGLGSTKGVAVGSEEAPTTYADRMREKALKRFNS